MKHSDIDSLLAQLGTTLKTLDDRTKEAASVKLSGKAVNQLLDQIPYGAISGDKISGGSIKNFSSTGIADSATNVMLTVTDEGIKAHNATIKNIKGNVSVENTLTSENIVVTKDLTVSGVLRANVDVDYNDIIRKIPNRSLSGDKINGGTIRNFASTGIKDSSTAGTKITITDEFVALDTAKISSIKDSVTVENTLTSKDIEVTGELRAKKIHVEELLADIRIERTAPLEFKQSAGNPIIGKGLIWTGAGYTKQFILRDNDQIFSTENLNLHTDRSYNIDGIPVLSTDTLGKTVVRSNLREVGNLKKLTVLGDVNFNHHIFYNSTSEKIGVGTEEPNSDLSIVKDNLELMLKVENGKGHIGTYGYHDFAIVTDNTIRVTVGNNGHITLGDRNQPPTQVHVHGRVSIGVNSPDPNVDLHVNGPVRFNNMLQMSGTDRPTTGNYNKGDIVWNTDPRTGQPVGWVCITSGSPGDWRPFGIIG